MVKKNVPDAWDDDWETQADRSLKEEEQQPVVKQEPAIMSRAERLAQHKESNRKLWQSAEAPEEFHFLAANSDPPLATTFKPAMKVLSRRPAPKMITKRDPITGLERLTLQDDEADDDEAGNKQQPTIEEIRKRQQKELEEKQRRYEEARAKIFGESKSTPSSGQSTPGTVTPPQIPEGRQNQSQRGKGRGRGGHRGDHGRHESHNRRPANTTGARELYDPNFSPKPGYGSQKRGSSGASPHSTRSSTPREEDQVIRAPRGPDGSGRGGFGFARRGAKES